MKTIFLNNSIIPVLFQRFFLNYGLVMCCFNQKTMTKDTKNDLISLFTISQRTSAVHQRNSIVMKNLYEDSDHEEFFEFLKQIISRILIVEKGGQYIVKVMDFFGKFCSLLNPKQDDCDHDTEDYIEHPLFTKIISYLLEASNSNKDIVRLRSCQLINKILDNLVGIEVSEELCEKLENTLLPRLQDSKSNIRQQAIISLHRIQDPTNPDDAIISNFTYLMNSDAFAKVRLLCVEKVAARSDIITYLINRIRDTDANVRLSAFKRISAFSRFLQICEKHVILHCGFSDQSEKVREFVSSVLVKTWLEHYDNDILDFLKSIRLDANKKDIENTTSLFESVLGTIFKDTPLKNLSAVLNLNDRKLIPFEDLNWESVSYWRIYVQFLSQNDEFDEEFDQVLPELIYFCKYIKEYYTSRPKEVTAVDFLEQQFILKQLFLITNTYDFAEITNRKCQNALVSNILENLVLMSDVTEVIVGTLEYSIPEIEKRCQFISEILSEILYPLNLDECQEEEREKEFQISQLSVKLNQLRQEKDDAIQQQNFIEAERLKNDLSQIVEKLENLKNAVIIQQQRQVEKKTDLLTTVKCLDIVAATLLSPKVTHLTSSLKALKEDFIQELLISENGSVRVKALRCYALCCIIDKETARSGIHVFSTPIFAYKNGIECDTQTLIVCMAAVVDLLRIYGSQLMAAPENDELSESMNEEQQAVFAGGTSLTDVLQGLVDLMDDEQYEIQEKACLGLCQLILSGRILSPSLICRLVLKWCNPATDDDNEVKRLQQIIGHTLEQMPSMTQCTEQLTDAVMMTVTAVFAAPRNSPLANVNIENIAKFLLALCKTSPDAAYIHSQLATTVCNEILNKPNSKMNVIFSKMLLMLDLPNGKGAVRELLVLCDEIKDNVRDRTVINNVIKLVTRLNTKCLDFSSTLEEVLPVEDETETNSRRDDVTEDTEEEMINEDESD